MTTPALPERRAFPASSARPSPQSSRELVRGLPARLRGVARGALLVTGGCLLTACGAGGASHVAVDPAPPPPTPPAEEEAAPEAAAPDVSTPDAPQDSAAADAPAAQAPRPADADLPDLDRVAGGSTYPPAVRIGALVDHVRSEPDEIVVEVGDSLAMGEDVSVVAYDADGSPVRGVRILTNIDDRAALLEGGFVKGIAEGEATLRMSFQAPPTSGRGPPEVRTFSASVRVVGLPVATLEIVDPGVRFLAGSSVPLTAVARAEDGSERASAEIAWSSNRRRLATVDERGNVQGVRPGEVVITAEAEGVQATFELVVEADPVVTVEVSGAARARTGDVIRFAARGLDEDGREVEGARAGFTASSMSTRSDMGASIYPDGAFVAERPGVYRVAATVGGRWGQTFIEVVDRDAEHDVVVVGRSGPGERTMSDLWVFTGIDGRDYAYTGTHLGGAGAAGCPPGMRGPCDAGGHRMHAWDVTDPANPVLTDVVEVDARVVNDVKVNSAGTVAAITREGASDRRNGIVLLDLTDPAHPVVADTYVGDLTGGVHNVFFHGSTLYAIHNGTFDVHILDVADPRDVDEVGRWGIDSPGKYLHDIWVVDGMAYVSYWNDGVFVLDVGDGRWGGTPTEPVEVSHLAYPEGNTHFAVPYTNADGHRYLFVGDEIFDCETCVSRNGHPGDGSRGFVHVIDLENPEELREVARYEVPEAGAHNLWIEDDKMYVAYYQAGLRVVDVSGELRGDLYRQGREIAWLPTGSPDGLVPNSPMAWGPQLFKGHVFVSDMHSGLWVVRVEPRQRPPVS